MNLLYETDIGVVDFEKFSLYISASYSNAENREQYYKTGNKTEVGRVVV